MKRVFVITDNGNSQLCIEHLLKEELLKRLADDWYGQCRMMPLLPKVQDGDAVDVDNWPDDGMLVIEGVINPPQPKRIVEEYTFDTKSWPGRELGYEE